MTSALALGLLGVTALAGCASGPVASRETRPACAEMLAMPVRAPSEVPAGVRAETPTDAQTATTAAARAEHPAAAPPMDAAPALLDWRRARARLGDLRSRLVRSEPHTRRLSLKLREPYTGRVMEARGAVALAPPSALRMILLGPGGTTALDLWVKEDRFRFAVPAIDLLRRGDASTPRDQMRGLPVDFLKWWLLRPAEGTLLWYEREGAADRFVLRDGSAIVDLCASDSGAIAARRTTWTPPHAARASAPTGASDQRRLDEERVVATRLGCGPVRYTQTSTGLDIAVTCEGEELGRAPSPRAFEDPDSSVQEGGDDGEPAGGEGS